MSRQKRYSFADPMLRLWVRLHCRAGAADRKTTSRARCSSTCSRGCRTREPALALAGAQPADRDESKSWGIIEID